MEPTDDRPAVRPAPANLPNVRHYIDGAWRASTSGAEYEKYNPWTGDVLNAVSAGDAEDVRLAIAAAYAAREGWAGAAPSDRQQIFLRAADILARRADEIAGLLAVETGCGRHFADVQIDFSVSLLRQAAGLAYAPTGQLIPSDRAGTQAFAIRRPVGVVGAIAPWNASLVLAGRAIVGPLAVGNTVVLKPSEESPLTGGSLWAELFHEAGLPAGVLNVVTHAPGDAGDFAASLAAGGEVAVAGRPEPLLSAA